MFRSRDRLPKVPGVRGGGIVKGGRLDGCVAPAVGVPRMPPVDTIVVLISERCEGDPAGGGGGGGAPRGRDLFWVFFWGNRGKCW